MADTQGENPAAAFEPDDQVNPLGDRGNGNRGDGNRDVCHDERTGQPTKSDA